MGHAQLIRVRKWRALHWKLGRLVGKNRRTYCDKDALPELTLLDEAGVEDKEKLFACELLEPRDGLDSDVGLTVGLVEGEVELNVGILEVFAEDIVCELL